jgi:kumamolisin
LQTIRIASGDSKRALSSRPHIRKAALWLTALALFGLSAACAQAQKPAAPVAAAQAGWQPLSQGVPAAARPQWRVGPRQATAPQSVTVALRLPNQNALEAFVRQLNDPGSPQYHRFLTPAQFAERFSPSPADYAAVAAHLQASGLKIERTSANRLTVKASGTVAQVQRAFATTIAVYQDGNRSYYANETAPKLPAAVAPLVEGAFGLDNLPLLHPIHKSLAKKKKQFTPPQIRTAYNLDPFYANGIRGAGKTIAIFSSFQRTPADNNLFINDWIKTMSSTPASYAADITDIAVDGGPTDSPNNGNVEADLDLELILFTAPDAKILFYGGPATGQGQFDTLAQIVSDNLADIASESYGGSELSIPQGQFNAEHTLYLAAAANGMSYFCASGDQGSKEGGQLSVGYPASDPVNIAVGGTSLTLDGSNHITGETGWNGSGGGVSVQWSAPAWQMNLGIDNPGNSRLVPDVALDADMSTGYVIYSGGHNNYPFDFYNAGGTSASCPMWAGASALIELLLDQNSFTQRQGTISALWYPLQSSGAFHDIIAGDNRQSGTGTKYSCQVGYDLVTGLGSADFFALANAMLTTVSGTVTLPDCVNMAQTLSFEFRPQTGSTNFTVTQALTASGGFSLTVPRASYKLAIKGSKWLQKVVAADASGGAVSGLAVTLPAGDINNDNAVNIVDLGLMADTFGKSQGQTGFNPNADLNCDNKVDIFDLGILADFFGQNGDP